MVTGLVSHSIWSGCICVRDASTSKKITGLVVFVVVM
jgi:hypothetical protein